MNLKAALGGESKKVTGTFWQGAYLFDSPHIPADPPVENTCFVTATRDPVEHFLSGYNEMEYRNTPEYMRRRSNPKYKKWNNPLEYSKLGNGTEARFKQFVSDFVESPLTMSTYALEVSHAYSMTGILWGLTQAKWYPTKDLPRLTAYLPTLNNLDEAFPNLINSHCEGVPQLKTFREKYEHVTSGDPHNFYAAAKNVWRKQEGKYGRALCALHALDYACFDDIPVGDLCRSVFEDGQFIDYLEYWLAQNKTL